MARVEASTTATSNGLSMGVSFSGRGNRLRRICQYSPPPPERRLNRSGFSILASLNKKLDRIVDVIM
jgi:hypothetical protein